jgi:electron transfer flavoprotein beta subunit
MKAKKKQLDVVYPKDLGVQLQPHLKVLRVDEPPVRQAGAKVADVPALLEALKKEGFVK